MSVESPAKQFEHLKIGQALPEAGRRDTFQSKGFEFSGKLVDKTFAIEFHAFGAALLKLDNVPPEKPVPDHKRGIDQAGGSLLQLKVGLFEEGK